MNRRFFLKGLILAPVAPAICKAENLMKVSAFYASGNLAAYMDVDNGYVELDGYFFFFTDKEIHVSAPFDRESWIIDPLKFTEFSVK